MEYQMQWEANDKGMEEKVCLWMKEGVVHIIT